MLSIQGNLWTYPAEVRIITTNGYVKPNGACVMGRGCAREARDSIPGIDLYLGRQITAHGNRALRLYAGLWTMPVKHHWREQADLDLIVRSAHQLVEMADKFSATSLVLPRPGCGNGRLSWSTVGPLLEPILDDRFTAITF